MFLTSMFYPFFSEIGVFDTGLIIELWDKGMLWDKVIGYFWAPLHVLQCNKVVSQLTYIIV